MSNVMEKTIYEGCEGPANIYERNKIGKMDVKQQSRSVACLFKTDALKPTQSGDWELKNKIKFSEYVESRHGGVKFGEKEPFREEFNGGFGTAFLVDRKFAVTAKHCVERCKNFSDIKLVFDFALKDKDDTNYTNFEQKQVYEIKQWHLSPENEDWTLLELSKEVEGREPLSVDFRPDQPNLLSLYMLGHPCGLPLKVASEGEVQSEDKNSLKVKINAFRGNSGSPIINKITGKVVGILCNGRPDFKVDPEYPVSPDKKERRVRFYRDGIDDEFGGPFSWFKRLFESKSYEDCQKMSNLRHIPYYFYKEHITNIMPSIERNLTLKKPGNYVDNLFGKTNEEIQKQMQSFLQEIPNYTVNVTDAPNYNSQVEPNSYRTMSETKKIAFTCTDWRLWGSFCQIFLGFFASRDEKKIRNIDDQNILGYLQDGPGAEKSEGKEDFSNSCAQKNTITLYIGKDENKDCKDEIERTGLVFVECEIVTSYRKSIYQFCYTKGNAVFAIFSSRNGMWNPLLDRAEFLSFIRRGFDAYNRAKQDANAKNTALKKIQDEGEDESAQYMPLSLYNIAFSKSLNERKKLKKDIETSISPWRFFSTSKGIVLSNQAIVDLIPKGSNEIINKRKQYIEWLSFVITALADEQLGALFEEDEAWIPERGFIDYRVNKWETLKKLDTVIYDTVKATHKAIQELIEVPYYQKMKD